VGGGAQVGGGRRGHGDVVLLHRRGGDRVRRRRYGGPLQLGDQGGLGVLGDHQAGVDTGVVGEEWRQSVAAVLVQQPVGAALGDGGQVGDGDGEEVQDVGDGRPVEVPVGLHPASPRAESLGGTPRQYDGIVDGGGEFTLGDQPGVGQRVASGAGDLRGAAHGVGVLDPGGVVLVMPRQPRTLQYGEHVGGAG